MHIRYLLKRLYNLSPKSFQQPIRTSYFYIQKLSDKVHYNIAASLCAFSLRAIVLTFDDLVDSTNISIANWLSSKGIPATFFIPGETRSSVIKDLVSFGHEVGGHGFYHSPKDRIDAYKTSAQRVFEKISRFERPVSWRFPYVSYTPTEVMNVFRAGFRVDSSRCTFYPVFKFSKLGPLKELKWLRYPFGEGMDLEIDNRKYLLFRRWLINKLSSEVGIFVLPFHIYHQYKLFPYFKALINKISKIRNVRFLRIRDVLYSFKNFKLFK